METGLCCEEDEEEEDKVGVDGGGEGGVRHEGDCRGRVWGDVFTVP